MNFRIRLLLFLLVAGISFSLTGCARNTAPLTQTGFYFDTVIQITLYDTQDTAVLEGCFALADTYEKMFSATIEGSDLWRINHSGGSPVTVSEDTAALLQAALYYAGLTEGRIDPTILPVSQLWHFGTDDTPQIPEASALEEALSHVSYQNIAIDGSQVTLNDPQAAIDLGFIAKGYIADRIRDYLLEQEVHSACVNLGGNVMVVGSKPDGSPFTIGIQKAFAQDGVAEATINVSDTSVVTSGIYQRYFYEDGMLYHHILNTSTGYPVENDITSVTILCPSSVDADALSTACYCLGVEEGIKLLNSMEDIEYLFLMKDGSRHVSDGFPLS
ncbi:MAG: FAD:protein FMN transferase [Clostridiales bacterium]|nr:FAD:protein FMN transferase [Clostridiales bacterium]